MKPAKQHTYHLEFKKSQFCEGIHSWSRYFAWTLDVSILFPLHLGGLVMYAGLLMFQRHLPYLLNFRNVKLS
jgi:hypothetical protein